MVESWMARLMGGSATPPSLLSTHIQLLKLVASLGTRPALEVLEGRLSVKGDPALFQEVSESQLLTSIRSFLAGAPTATRAAFLGAVTEACVASNSQGNTDDSTLRNLMNSIDPGQSPTESVAKLHAHVEQVVSMWSTAFDDPQISPLAYATERQATSAHIMQALVGTPFESTAAPTLGPSAEPSPRVESSATSSPKSRAMRWRTRVARLQGRMSSRGSPLWCSDLVPPDPQVKSISVGTGVQQLTPKSVFIGGYSGNVPDFAGKVTIPFPRFQKLVSSSVLKYMPSGSTSVQLLQEYSIHDIALPATTAKMVLPPSMVANCVTWAPGLITPEGEVSGWKL